MEEIKNQEETGTVPAEETAPEAAPAEEGTVPAEEAAPSGETSPEEPAA